MEHTNAPKTAANANTTPNEDANPHKKNEESALPKPLAKMT